MGPNDKVEFKSRLEIAIATLGIPALSEKEARRLTLHYSMVCKWNQRLNLTRITDAREAAKLHYAESLLAAKFVGTAVSLLDIGSGAGFPVIPLAVCLPDVRFTALESNQKKSTFLKEAKDELGLANLNVACDRAEGFNTAGYDVLTSRALDRAETILPLILDRLESTQKFVLFCGEDLLTKLGKLPSLKIDSSPIPESESRYIALIFRRT
jgi:16S rRNA (guanine527-N7)-methyltransferase